MTGDATLFSLDSIGRPQLLGCFWFHPPDFLDGQVEAVFQMTADLSDRLHRRVSTGSERPARLFAGMFEDGTVEWPIPTELG